MSAPLQAKILVGDALAMLRTLPDESANCCVTSPPYWGLRDYGVDGQIGLEETFDEFLARLVAVFREVRRVLRNDGVAWVNMGDSYAGSWGNQGRKAGRGTQRAINGPMLQNVGSAVHAETCDMDEDCGCGSQDEVIYQQRTKTGSLGRLPAGTKGKDLIGQPWRLAFALQADGWWLRSDCIWHKPNPMPESITDRPTKAHEYVFLLTKSARYFYDAEAVRQPYAGSTVAQRGQDYVGVATKNYQGAKAQDPSDTKRRVIESMEHRGGANLRTVWSITTSPYAGAHFATFPEALAERCILSGCPSGGTVLDPFTGSGTTGAVAVRLGRSFVGTELNPEYAELARQRIDEVQPLFTKARLVAEAAKEAKP